MTLRLRRLINRGKIKKNTYNPEKYSPRTLKNTMDRVAPGLSMSAVLQPENDYTISFDWSHPNMLLEKEIKRLRNKGVDIEYYTGTSGPEGKEKKRLFVEFSPKDDLEWAYIRGMFGLPSNVTDEVSSAETIETIGDN